MMKNYIVKELISRMRERIPRGQNLANYLTDTLCMGKEAIYRRLRGEVAFTFDEIAMISCSLGISIDQVIGNHLSNRVTFDLNLLHSQDLLDSYQEIIERYLQIFLSTNENGIKVILYMTLITAMLIMIYKRKNDIGYSDAKFCFKIEMEAWITALSITITGGDLSKFYNRYRIRNRIP